MENSNRSLHIRQIAVQLLEEHRIHNHFEINILSLISNMDQPISYQFADLKGLAGFTCFDIPSNRFRMFFDSITHENCPARTSFTVAHELGHIILNHFSKTSINSIFFGDRSLEFEANLFADELLMPTLPIIKHRLNAYEIMQTYNVSAAAASNKIKYLKNNAIYTDKQVKDQLQKIFTKCNTVLSWVEEEQDRMTDYLRDRWLDPDSDGW